MFVSTSRKEIAPEVQDAISSILKNKIQEGLDPLLALTSGKATATGKIADMRMTKTDDRDQRNFKHRLADLLCEETIKKGYCSTRSCSGKHGKWNTGGPGEPCKAEKEGKPCYFLTKSEALGCKFKHGKCVHTST